MSERNTAMDVLLLASNSGILGAPSGAPPGPHLRLNELAFSYGSDDSKRALTNFVGWVLHDNDLLQMQDLHEYSTVDDVVTIVAARLAVSPNRYRCTAARSHYFRSPGTGRCIFDATPIVLV